MGRWGGGGGRWGWVGGGGGGVGGWGWGGGLPPLPTHPPLRFTREQTRVEYIRRCRLTNKHNKIQYSLEGECENCWLVVRIIKDFFLVVYNQLWPSVLLDKIFSFTCHCLYIVSFEDARKGLVLFQLIQQHHSQLLNFSCTFCCWEFIGPNQITNLQWIILLTVFQKPGNHHFVAVSDTYRDDISDRYSIRDRIYYGWHHILG